MFPVGHGFGLNWSIDEFEIEHYVRFLGLKWVLIVMGVLLELLVVVDLSLTLYMMYEV